MRRGSEDGGRAQARAQVEVSLLSGWGLQGKHFGNIAVFVILPYPSVDSMITRVIVFKKLVYLKNTQEIITRY